MMCEHQDDDGAYVLGALSSAEQDAYERHLATCSFCREAVADIAFLPGMLGRLHPDEFAALFDPTLTKPSGPIPEVSKPPRVKASKTRVRVLSAVLVAVVVVVATGLWTLLSGADPAAAAMTRVAAETSLSAQISVTPLAGATQVTVTCAYDRSTTALRPRQIMLMGYGPGSETEAMGSWIATPGGKFTMTGVTHFMGPNLSRLTLVGNDGAVLLAYDVP